MEDKKKQTKPVKEKQQQCYLSSRWYMALTSDQL